MQTRPRSSTVHGLHDATVSALMACCEADGSHWRGELSDSSLATAIALVAWRRVDGGRYAEQIAAAQAFLLADQNGDGGWGDSPESPSNLTATLLVWSALQYGAEGSHPKVGAAVAEAASFLGAACGGLSPGHIERAVLARYGNDRTFAAPILMLCALTGTLGEAGWCRLPRLPFEMALLPHPCFRLLDLTVVSYALPALIAIGLVRHAHLPPRSSMGRWIYRCVVGRLLTVAARMQPEHGGYEEAAPLTGFVAMSLAEAGFSDHAVVQRGCAFLVASQRGNGALPIDTDLANWVTVLAVQALAMAGDSPLGERQQAAIAAWLLENQHDRRHPLTFGAPGGWPWSDCPGAMPDADDTAGTLLSLSRLGLEASVLPQVEAGLRWLLCLQNRDGGIPTFSRGWGRLPFDRSCCDISAHTLQAFAAWVPHVRGRLRRRLARAMRRIIVFLEREREEGGGWNPLWFGSQYNDERCNRVHGTARVVCSLVAAEQAGVDGVGKLAREGGAWLQKAQGADGGWGGMPGESGTIEETALAVTALAALGEERGVASGLGWLITATSEGTCFPAAPIGLYFDQLWYAEKLYPITFCLMATTAALSLGEEAQGRGTGEGPA
jgi:squalene-hopene/tetraprenyl-beta-curcumene cyclase